MAQLMGKMLHRGSDAVDRSKHDPGGHDRQNDRKTHCREKQAQGQFQTHSPPSGVCEIGRISKGKATHHHLSMHDGCGHPDLVPNAMALGLAR